MILIFREASKMQKHLRIKCKEMLAQTHGKRYEGTIDDPNVNLWPAPLKIIHQTINSMKEFRVCIFIIFRSFIIVQPKDIKIIAFAFFKHS